MSVVIRDATSADLDVLYDVCLRTGRAGQDASGHVDTTPARQHLRRAVRRAARGDRVRSRRRVGVGGYVLGTLDMRSFETARGELVAALAPTARGSRAFAVDTG